MPQIHANGIDFTYLDAGDEDAPLALCLHGFPDDAHTWEHLLPRLADAGFYAVAPWMRGYAPTSSAPDGNYQVGSLALDALALADALAGDRPAVLVGHDWGAIAAYTATAHRPERFRRLVTIAVPHVGALGQHIFEVPNLKTSWYQYFFQTPMAELAVPLDDWAVIETLWSDWSPNWTVEPARLRRVKDTLATPGVLDAAIAYYRFMLGGRPGDPALDEVQAAVSAPVPLPSLYLHGTADGIYGPDCARRDELEPFYPAGLDHELVAGAGHFLHLERPDEIGERITTFLEPALEEPT